MTVSAGLPSRETEWKFIGSLPLPLVKSAPILPVLTINRNPSGPDEPLLTVLEQHRNPLQRVPPAPRAQAARQRCRHNNPPEGTGVNASVKTNSAGSGILHVLRPLRSHCQDHLVPWGLVTASLQIPSAGSGMPAKVRMGTKIHFKR